MASIYIGTAGWPIPAPLRAVFPGEGSLLARYAARFRAVEINSSFYRPHRSGTYARWASVVPDGFKFAIKAPKAVTHEGRLQSNLGALTEFIAQCRALGDRLGPVLVQLPPSLPFNPVIAGSFFERLRRGFAGSVVLEPREVSWFSDAATALLLEHRIGRVGADPALIPDAAIPGAWPEPVYYRWHGSPRMYYSPYEQGTLAQLAAELVRHRQLGREVWCVFDNTAAGAATANALELRGLISGEQ